MKISCNNLKIFLQNNIIKENIKVFKAINRGGTSLNFLCQTQNKKFLVKAINKEKKERVLKLCTILKALENEPLIYTARLETFENKVFFEYENWLILILSYIDGKRVSDSELTPTLIDKIFSSYQHISKINISAAPKKDLSSIYLENKQKLEELKKINKSFIQSKILNLIDSLNEMLKTDVTLKQTITIIHGDASLNNCLKDKHDNIVLLDFELMRYGYIIEDWAEFFISSLSQHSILFIATKRLKNLIIHANSLFNFTKAEWLYGTNLYFLNLINKRLKSKKLFKSIRKALLFTLNIKKYKHILNIINSLY